MSVARTTGTVTTTGTGRRDYSSEIARGQLYTAPGELKSTEKLVIWAMTFSAVPSVYPWVQGPLAVGDTVHIVDVETGVALPYTVPQGYVLEQLDLFWAFNRKIKTRQYGDRFLGVLQLLQEVDSETLGTDYVKQLTGFSSSLFDPQALAQHEVDMTGTNIDVEACTGSGSVLNKLIRVGSPPWPKTKTVRCRVCGATHTVSQETVGSTCSGCGALTKYQSLPWGGKRW